jgi:uncharacterized protein (DUF1684 family)
MTVALVGAQAPAGSKTDPRQGIRTFQAGADAEYARALMSPFTAVAVQYFEQGQTHRLAVGPDGVVFDPKAPLAHAVDLVMIDGEFWITPVSGAAPSLNRTDGRGGLSDAPAIPVSGRTRVERRLALSLGRYLVEFNLQQTLGNARVFDPDAPARKAFSGLKWFPPEPAFQVNATFTPSPTPDKIVISTSRGLRRDYYRVGTFRFEIDGAAQQLTALAMTATVAAGDDLFVPFRDATTGTESYEVGRYLELKALADPAAYVLDFNEATNPLCNYSPHYNCPIPPRENVLTVPVRAGEMTYPKHH